MKVDNKNKNRQNNLKIIGNTSINIAKTNLNIR